MENINITSSPKMTKKRKTLKIVAGITIAATFILGIIAGAGSVYFYRQIAQARDDVRNSIDSWADFHLDLAKDSIFSSRENILSAKKTLAWTKPFRILPWIGPKLNTGDKLLDSSLDALYSYERTVNVTEKLEGYRGKSYEQIEDKEVVIAVLGELLDSIEDVYVNIQQMIVATHELGISDIALVQKFEQEFSRFNEDDFKVLHLLHSIMSKRGEQTYLLLMQNNTELRPTGGYIGNFGILNIKDGEVPTFYLKDTDDLEENYNSTKSEPIIPPTSLAKYFNKNEWRFGDANWSPSFPETARNAQMLYNAEVARDKTEQIEFDSVIAFNPEMVSEWLNIIGAVKIDFTEDIEYTAENFKDTPQNLYPGERVEDKIVREKTYIVDDIAQQVKEKMLNSDIKTVIQILGTLRHNLEDNNLFFYFNNKTDQQVLAKNNWTGELEQSDQDYIYVVDANISTQNIKTRLDHLVKRNINYKIDIVNNRSIATLKLTYFYNAELERKEGLYEERISGNYKTYTRVYVPAGAKLINYQGEYEVDILNELNKTGFGTLISVRPNDTTELTLVYELPFELKDDYYLLLQKQPGNEFTSFNINLPLAKDAQVFPNSNKAVIQEDVVTWNGLLDENLEFIISK